MNADRVVHLVDDEEAIRKSAGFVLSRAGYKVHPYGSGVEFQASKTRSNWLRFAGRADAGHGWARGSAGDGRARDQHAGHRSDRTW
jgi:hypothetical protein